MKNLFVVVLLGCLVPPGLAAQHDTLAVHRTGLTLIPTLGWARGAGNGFLDAALGASIYAGRMELRVHFGALGFGGGCDLVFPSKCGDGDGEYYDASVGFRFTDDTRPAAAWTISVGPGGADGRGVATLGLTVGRDEPVGRRWLFRVEFFGRHLFDDSYEDTWGTPHRQFGIRFGVGAWTSLD